MKKGLTAAQMAQITAKKREILSKEREKSAREQKAVANLAKAARGGAIVGEEVLQRCLSRKIF